MLFKEEETNKDIEDIVSKPKHYFIGNVEAKRIIDIVLRELELSPMEAYTFGNILKYRLRAGKKTANPAIDIAKALKYEEMFNEFK